MNLFFLRPAAKNPKEPPGKQLLVHIEALHDTSEGSEFLDDAIRTEDLPLVYTEESVAAGSPLHLL